MKCIVANNAWLISLLMMTMMGCVSVDTRTPRIVSTQELDPPLVEEPSIRIPTHTQSSIWSPHTRSERDWQAIVIHHSATTSGNAAIFDRWHREQNHWNGVGYDFVIGNGSESGDGQVEVTYRWQQQLVGAHCRTPNNWANEHAIGICLVGDFSQERPTDAQMKSLVQLVQFLRQRYSIARYAVYGHQDTPGARITACPGRLFPWDELRGAM